MIRPITVICWILALGAGLYLYRAKHEVELMDKQIDQIARETNDIRAASRHLLDDWIRLGEPEQLHKYSDEYLGLKTIAPTQFSRLSDLMSRLPAPRVDPPPVETDEAVVQPVAQPVGAPSSDVGTDSVDEADTDSLPIPPIPPPVNSVTLPAVTAVPLQARPVTPRVAAEQKPHPVDTTMVEEPRQSPPRPTPVAATEARQPAQMQPVALPPLQNAVRGHDLPPLQAQEQSRPRDVPWRPQGQVPLQAQGSRSMPDRPPEARVAGDPRREIPPVAPRTADPRGPESQPPRPVAVLAAPAGSLLGSAHGGVPLPLPAPTPVSASWPGPGR